MDIKQIGDDYIEASCCSCGEALLISSNDVVNVKVGKSTMLGNTSIPVPVGLLCYVCNKQENAGKDLSIKFIKPVCCNCGEPLKEVGNVKLDENSNVCGVFCLNCSENEEENHEENFN